MKAKSLFLLFLLSSTLLILLCLFLYATPLNEYRLEMLRLSKIQKVCMKEYIKKRDKHIYIYSLEKAQQEIDRYLQKNPLEFVPNSTSFEENNSVPTQPNLHKVTLAGITKVLNTLTEKVALSIATHTDKAGSQQENLKLSQARADILKAYMQEKSNVSFISSIGYGEELPLTADINGTNRRVELHLKRIQP
ncbi:OmpA family protein [bacterium]|nr:OmpA family protein [bacterium]MBU1957337.1 OmpA family protein [bacterium]